MLSVLKKKILTPCLSILSNVKNRLWDSISPSPFFSILIPVYNTAPDILKKTIESVINQSFSNWELCIVDDASTRTELRSILEFFSVNDHRIRIKYSKKNQGIAATLNIAAGMASGKYIGVLDHDDELSHHALSEFFQLIQSFPDADLIYCDEDKIDETGNYCEAWYKSDWNPDLALSFNYVMHFAVYRLSLFKKLGGFRKAYEGSQDYDLLLRVSEVTDRIYHIPKILYHWRKGINSIASGPSAKPKVFESGLSALNDALRRRGIDGRAEDAPNAWKGVYRVIRTIKPLRCSVIILSNSQKGFDRLFDSIKTHIKKPIEIVICSNYLEQIKQLPNSTMYQIKLISVEKSMTVPAQFNTGASQASGDVLLFLDDTMEIVSSDSIDCLLEHAQRHEVGAVGGKVYYSNGLVEHAGIIFGPFNLLGYSHRATPDDTGYAGLKVMIGNYSAVMGLGMMTRKTIFFRYNGFDEKFLTSYWDADFCLKLRNNHLLITYTPYAKFIHYCAVKTKLDMITEPDATLFKSRWQHVIDHDPYFNPNFSREWECFWV